MSADVEQRQIRSWRESNNELRSRGDTFSISIFLPISNFLLLFQHYEGTSAEESERKREH